MNGDLLLSENTSRRDVLLSGLMVVAATALPVASVAQTSGKQDFLTSNRSQGTKTMSMITTKDGTDIYYKDWGSKDAQPIVFHHGWPLSGDDLDMQMLYFLG